MKKIAKCHPDKPHQAHGLCANCYARIYMRDRRQRNAEKWRAEHPEYFRQKAKERNKKRKGKRQAEATTARLRNYRLTLDSYAKLVFGQRGVCKSCKQHPDRRGFHIDHDHACCPGPTSCGKCVRGLLCGKCNCTLGYAGDSKYILLRLVDYLDQWGSARADEPIVENDFYGS